MPVWMLIVCFVFGYVASSYHLPYILYEQLVSVPDMSHKLLLAIAALSLTLTYGLCICAPLEKLAASECKSHHPSSHVFSSSSSSSSLSSSPISFLMEDEEDEDEGEEGGGSGMLTDDDEEEVHSKSKWNHMFTRRRGSF